MCKIFMNLNGLIILGFFVYFSREKEGLLHRFEIDVKSSKNGKRPKADIAKIVKCFERSAAGKEMAGSNELRPGPVLLMTLRYLFTE